MSAYVIVEVEVRDPVRYEEYKKMAAASLAAHGGRFLARGGAVETLEGDWKPGRMVVLEFPSAEAAKVWWDAPDYRPAKELRQATASTRMIVVDGV